MNKQKLLSALKEGVVEVTFTKVNGTKRTMECTLNESALPPKTDITEHRESNPSVQNVWSVLDEGWRSFRWDSIVDWSVVE